MLESTYAWSTSKTREKDLFVAGRVYKGYKSYAARVKTGANRGENARKKMGDGLKMATGRVPKMSLDQWNKCLCMMDAIARRNACSAIMAEIGAKAIATCQGVLLMDLDTIGHTKDEDHVTGKTRETDQGNRKTSPGQVWRYRGEILRIRTIEVFCIGN